LAGRCQIQRKRKNNESRKKHISVNIKILNNFFETVYENILISSAAAIRLGICCFNSAAKICKNQELKIVKRKKATANFIWLILAAPTPLVNKILTHPETENILKPVTHLLHSETDSTVSFWGVSVMLEYLK